MDYRMQLTMIDGVNDSIEIDNDDMSESDSDNEENDVNGKAILVIEF